MKTNGWSSTSTHFLQGLVNFWADVNDAWEEVVPLSTSSKTSHLSKILSRKTTSAMFGLFTPVAHHSEYTVLMCEVAMWRSHQCFYDYYSIEKPSVTRYDFQMAQLITSLLTQECKPSRLKDSKQLDNSTCAKNQKLSKVASSSTQV